MLQAKHTLTIEGEEVVLINGFPVTEKLVRYLGVFSEDPSQYRREIHENITKYAIYRSWVEMEDVAELKFMPQFLVNLEFLIDVLDEMAVLAPMCNKNQED